MINFKSLLAFVAAAVLLASCSKVSSRKTPGGMPYTVYKGKGGKEIFKGNFIKVHLTQKVKDSVYFTSEDKLPIYIPVTEPNPYDISETWTKLRVGDSIVAVQMMDTFIKRNPGSIPKEFKAGDRIMTYVKILDVFTSDSAVTKDEKKMQEEHLVKEVKFMENYTKGKKVEKTPSGAFVEILQPGTGNLIDSGNYVALKYTGTSFSGVKFDSNTDTSFHHSALLTFNVGNGQMMRGFDEAMRLLRKGTVAKIYIPSLLAYGTRPLSPLIKPLEHLVFDVEVVDVQLKGPASADPRQDPRPNVDMPQSK